MPQVRVYVRESDLTKWIAIEDKAQFLSDAINGTRGFSEVPVKEPSDELRRIVESTPPSNVFIPRPPDPKTGYPCCVQKRPCKHWQWDANKALYVNTLTGKEREADIV